MIWVKVKRLAIKVLRDGIALRIVDHAQKIVRLYGSAALLKVQVANLHRFLEFSAVGQFACQCKLVDRRLRGRDGFWFGCGWRGGRRYEGGARNDLG